MKRPQNGKQQANYRFRNIKSIVIDLVFIAILRNKRNSLGGSYHFKRDSKKTMSIARRKFKVVTTKYSLIVL